MLVITLLLSPDELQTDQVLGKSKITLLASKLDIQSNAHLACGDTFVMCLICFLDSV